MAAEVRDNRDRHRYEIDVDGGTAGFAKYRLGNGTVVFTHTEIDPAYEGRGLGSILAREALDDVRVRGLRVVPVCPFIARYIERHPRYGDLLASEEPSQP